MTDLSDIIRILPPMRAGEDLFSALEVLPKYDESICTAEVPVRLMALSDLYRIYVPSQMSLEIYSKMYLALLRSLQKKGTKLAVYQKNQNYKAIIQQEYSGIMGGSDSFTIIGASGIGKSSAISRAITLITENRVIEVGNPYTKIIPCICVQCPFDSSVKGLLLEILRKVDEMIDSKYYQNALRARTTTDMLIGNVSQVALNHIGLLVVDEIQNVCNSKNGKSLVGMLTQLINNSGISICMVGTPESAVFFEQAMQLARRSLGLRYDVMEYGASFRAFCETVFSYQYVKQRTEITDPQYARFIPLTEKKKALYHLGHDSCDVHHLFPVLPRNDGERYLRFCPSCVKEDRETYGEAYWHAQKYCDWRKNAKYHYVKGYMYAL